MKEKIGVFYGSTTCYTEMAAEKISAQINILTKTDCTRLHDINDTSVLKMADYKYLIAGIPTWDFGELQEDWEDQWEKLREINLESKYVALFGLGDQVGYPEWFQDAMGYLWQKLKDQGAIMVGTWPNHGYSFTDSKANHNSEDNTANDDNAIAHGASLGYDYLFNNLISSSISLGVSDSDAKADPGNDAETYDFSFGLNFAFPWALISVSTAHSFTDYKREDTSIDSLSLIHI